MSKKLQLNDLIGNKNIHTQLTIANGAARLHNKAMGHVLFSGQAGCHRKGTQILMADGSSSSVELIKVDDLVMGPDGFRKVTALHTGEDSMYKVTPTKGDCFYVNKKHILSLMWSGKTRPTGVINLTLGEYLQLSPTKQSDLKLYRASVKEFKRPPIELKLDPYFLGLTLGDGSISDKIIGITTQDQEIVEECREQAAKHGWNITEFIPDEYKFSSIGNRLKLLAGLIDSAGHLHNVTYDYITKSKQLANDVTFVARSLGFSAYPKLCFKRTQAGLVRHYYRMVISGDISEIPCKLPRKIAAPRLQIKSVLKLGFNIEKDLLVSLMK